MLRIFLLIAASLRQISHEGAVPLSSFSWTPGRLSLLVMSLSETPWLRDDSAAKVVVEREVVGVHIPSELLVVGEREHQL